MANYERGVYEPGDEVRVFDASEDEEDVEGSRLPLLIVLALVVLAMFAGVVYIAYTQGVAKGRGETPVLTAANGPARIAPQQPGGADVPYQGFKIYEQPAPPDDAAENPAMPPAAAQMPPATVTNAPPPAAKPAPQPVTVPPSRATEPAPKPAALAQAKPIVAPPRPAPAPIVIPAGPATAAPRQLGVPAPAVPAPAPPRPVMAKPASSAPASGSYVLQIGAYKSQADADAAWKTYKAKHAALLSGYSSDVQQADLGEKGTWYRLRVAGFSDRDVASALCDRLKADGGGCFLGK